MVTEFTRCPTSAWCASHLTHPARNISFFQRIIFRVDMRNVWMVLAKPLFSRRLTTMARAAERWQRQCSERRYVKAHAIPLRTCHASKLCPVSPKYFSHPSSPTTHLVKWRILGQKNAPRLCVPWSILFCSISYTSNASANTLRSSMVFALTVDSTVTIGSMMVMFFIASICSRIFLPDAGAHVPFSTKATLRFW